MNFLVPLGKWWFRISNQMIRCIEGRLLLLHPRVIAGSPPPPPPPGASAILSVDAAFPSFSFSFPSNSRLREAQLTI